MGKYDNGFAWINCKDVLPEEKENPITKDYYTYPVVYRNGATRDIRYYAFGNGHWWNGPEQMDKYVTHWFNIWLPEEIYDKT